MEMLQQSYFSLFGLPQQYPIDLEQLNRAYQQIQQQYHPDRFVTAEAQAQRESLQIATFANEAFQTLKQDAARARYLLQLHGIDCLQESNTVMPAEFLMRQLEWRESMQDAAEQHDLGALMQLAKQVRDNALAIKQALAQAFVDKQLEQAANLVRELSFIDKILLDIQQQIERC